MSDDALAALLADAHDCPARRWQGACPCPSVCRDKECCVDGSDLPPAVAEVLRTGEPSEAMNRAATTAYWDMVALGQLHDKDFRTRVEAAVRAAVGVLRDT